MPKRVRIASKRRTTRNARGAGGTSAVFTLPPTLKIVAIKIGRQRITGQESPGTDTTQDK